MLAMRARTTASGKEPPAVAMPGKNANATAAAGAIIVIDWNNTPGRPTAFGRSPTVAVVVVEGLAFLVAIRHLAVEVQALQNKFYAFDEILAAWQGP
jgi:hypothetical protein